MNSKTHTPVPGGLLRRMVIGLAACLSVLSAHAQTDASAPAEMVTPPRLAVAEGDVQFWRAGTDAWQPAEINAALATGDAINAGEDGTVELQIGPRDYLRLRAATMVTLVAYDATSKHFQLANGTATFDLRDRGAGQYLRVDADNANVAVAGHGYYRIETSDGETVVTVRNGGQATLTLINGQSRSVNAGEEIVVRGEGDVDIHPAPARDSWDRWNDDRTAWYANAESNRYVPAGVYGAADLDPYGRWREDTTYGWIWVPTVAVGWAPYSTGNWRWDPFYGWTWVDVAPWGWTTCHYGRWVHVGGGWAWAPGPRHVRVAYAPALVAFFQIDNGMSWVALGWGEPLVPWWGRPGFRGSVWWGGWGGPRLVTHVERHHYRNRHVHNAFITVRDADFGRRDVHSARMPLPSHAQPRLIRGEPPARLAPQRDRRWEAAPPRPRPQLVPRERERERSGPTPQVNSPRTRPAEPMRREFDNRRENPQTEAPRQRIEARPRAIVPVAPPESPRQRIEPQRPMEQVVPAAPQRQREFQREQRQEERQVERRMERQTERQMERPAPRFQPQSQPQALPQTRSSPRVEMPRQQVQTPSAPEMQRRGPEREQRVERRDRWQRERD